MNTIDKEDILVHAAEFIKGGSILQTFFLALEH